MAPIQKLKEIKWLLLGLPILGFFTLAGLSTDTEGDKTNKNWDDVENAFAENCLSSWDGSFPALKEHVQSNLHNPSSFEHVDTRFGSDGNQVVVIMKYRGENAFGATRTEQVHARVSTDCEIISVTDG